MKKINLKSKSTPNPKVCHLFIEGKNGKLIQATMLPESFPNQLVMAT